MMLLELYPKFKKRKGEQVSKMMSIAELGTEERKGLSPIHAKCSLSPLQRSPHV
jgi:hypothetical protein